MHCDSFSQCIFMQKYASTDQELRAVIGITVISSYVVMHLFIC